MDALDIRINGMFETVLANYYAGSKMSSASKGTERELFISEILSRVFPPHFRFTSGDVVDTKKHKTGQVDIVLEKPIGYSFPQTATGPRLFLAENVAAIIEVKSNIQTQWKEVLDSSAKVANLRRSYSNELYLKILAQIELGMTDISNINDKEKLKRSVKAQINNPDNIGKPRIPYFAIGFKGWKKDSTVISKLLDERIDGIFILESKKLFTKIGRAEGREVIEGNKSMLAFLHLLEIAFSEQPQRPPAYSQYL